MAESSAVGTAGGFFAFPYRIFTGNEARDEQRNRKILDSLAGLPNLFPVITSIDERRVTVAQYLTDPSNVAWEIWRGGELCGIFLLTRITVGVDALCHLALFDRALWNKRTLIRNMMGVVFRDFKLQRLSAEIPEHLDPLIRFARTKLGFQYEGEQQAAQHPVTGKITARGVNNAPKWMAHWGSRHERMHYDGTTYHDVVLLRLLREEYDAMEGIRAG